MIIVPFIALASFLQFVHSGEQKKAKGILPGGPAEIGSNNANGLMQSLFQEWKSKIASGEWIQHPEYIFESILATECEIAQNWQNQNSVEEHSDENLAKLTEEANKLCGAKNRMEYLKQNSQIAQKVPEFFHNDASMVVEGLKTLEIEDDTLAKLGQLTLQPRSKRGAVDVPLFDGAQLRILLVEISNLLRLVETKMDSGPTKKVMSKALGRIKVLLPSQLLELAKELWKVMVEEQGQSHEEDAVAQQHPAKSTQLRRKAQSQKAKDQKQFHALLVSGHQRRRRRMDKEDMTRHLTGFAMCLPIIIFAMYILSWLMAGVSSAANWLSELFWHPVTWLLLSAGLYLCTIKPHILPQFLRQLVKAGVISNNTSRRIKSRRFGFS